MQGFLELLKIIVIGFFALVALFLILLSIPKSKLRNLVLEIGGWTTAAGAAVYVVSPVDAIPGWMFPVIGQLDDLAVAVLGVIAAIFAKVMRHQRKKMEEAEERRRQLY
jgi:hypothetical protein